jgi:hypothetical protein
MTRICVIRSVRLYLHPTEATQTCGRATGGLGISLELSAGFVFLDLSFLDEQNFLRGLELPVL